jgi:DNA invertase Pin-like site-specific DNA recombinase
MALLGYARVSTDEQHARGQHDQLEAAGCSCVWTDAASGALAGRPRLKALLAYADQGDTVVVTRLDRLGRSLSHLVATVTELGDRGVGFRSLAEDLDTTTAAGRLVFHIFGALAQFERDLTRERTYAGLEAARARGRIGGRPSVMTAERCEAARRMLADGQQIAQIARTLGVSRATIYRHVAGSDGQER